MVAPQGLPQTLEQDISCSMRAGEAWSPVQPLRFRYARADPFAVTLEIPTARGRVVWVFGRDVLVDGLEDVGGGWDATAFRSDSGTHLHLVLSTGEGHAEFRFPVAEVRSFLEQTERVCPHGVDSALFGEQVDAGLGL